MHHLELSREGRESLLSFLRTLVQTPSPSGKESAVAALIMDEMRRLGYDQVWMDSAGNVLGRIGTTSGCADVWTVIWATVEVANRRRGRSLPLGVVD